MNNARPLRLPMRAKKRWKRAAAIWTLAGIAAWGAGKQIRHTFLEKTPETQQTQPHTEINQTQSHQVKRLNLTPKSVPGDWIEMRGGKWQYFPKSMSEELFHDRYRGNDLEVEERWSTIAKKAYAAFRERAQQTGKKFHPLPENEVDAICQEVETRTNVPAALIKAIFKQEAQFDPFAAAPDGGMGAGQLMPITLLDLKQRGYRVENPFDPIENLTGAAKHFKQFTKQAQARPYEYQGKETTFHRLPTRIQYMIVLRMYNAGPGNTFTNKIRGKNGYNVESIISQEYPRKVIAYFEQYQRER